MRRHFLGEAMHLVIDFFSCHDDLLVVTVDDYPYRDFYAATKLKDGKLQVDDEGYVNFSAVNPVVDEETRFS